MIFALLSVLLFLLGLGGRRVVFWAFLIFVMAPFSNSFSSWIYRFGLYPYDFYFFGLALRLVIFCVQKKRLPGYGLASLIVIIFILLYAMAGAYGQKIDGHYIKDLRPLMFAASSICLAWLVRSGGKPPITLGQGLLLVIISGGACVAWMMLGYMGLMSHEDVFYNDNSYRYLGVGTYVCSIYFLFHLSPISAKIKNKLPTIYRRMQSFALIACIASIIACGGRTLIVAIALIAVILNSFSIKRFLISAALAIVVVGSFVAISNSVGAQRVAEGLSTGGAQSQIETRYGPAIEKIRSMRGMQFFTGLGFGTTFDIPWFDYRGLDEENNFVDCAYLTFYVKYGALGILMLLCCFAWQSKEIFPISLSKKLSPAIFLFSLCLYVTYAVPYQSVGPGLLIGIALVAYIYQSGFNLTIGRLTHDLGESYEAADIEVY